MKIATLKLDVENGEKYLCVDGRLMICPYNANKGCGDWCPLCDSGSDEKYITLKCGVGCNYKRERKSIAK